MKSFKLPSEGPDRLVKLSDIFRYEEASGLLQICSGY